MYNTFGGNGVESTALQPCPKEAAVLCMQGLCTQPLISEYSTCAPGALGLLGS